MTATPTHPRVIAPGDTLEDGYVVEPGGVGLDWVIARHPRYDLDIFTDDAGPDIAEDARDKANAFDTIPIRPQRVAALGYVTQPLPQRADEEPPA